MNQGQLYCRRLSVVFTAFTIFSVPESTNESENRTITTSFWRFQFHMSANSNKFSIGRRKARRNENVSNLMWTCCSQLQSRNLFTALRAKRKKEWHQMTRTSQKCSWTPAPLLGFRLQVRFSLRLRFHGESGAAKNVSAFLVEIAEECGGIKLKCCALLPVRNGSFELSNAADENASLLECFAHFCLRFQINNWIFIFASLPQQSWLNRRRLCTLRSGRTSYTANTQNDGALVSERRKRVRGGVRHVDRHSFRCSRKLIRKWLCRTRRATRFCS